MIIKCGLCGDEFYTLPSIVRRKYGKYCSRKCYGVSQSLLRGESPARRRKSLNRHRLWRKKNLKYHKAQQLLSYYKNRKRKLAERKMYKHCLRVKVIRHYCENEPRCQCPGCTRTQICFLQIDHIKGGGRKHKNRNGRKYTGETLWLWLIKNNYPTGFQVLCSCCNFSKRDKTRCAMYGKPH